MCSENIDSLTESEFKELCKNLWAIKGWTKKEWRIENQILTPNGFDKIKTELKKLLYGTEESLHVGYNDERKNKSMRYSCLSFPFIFCCSKNLMELYPMLLSIVVENVRQESQQNNKTN